MSSETKSTTIQTQVRVKVRMGDRVAAWRFSNPESISIGRDRNQDVRVDLDWISRCHCVLTQEDGRWILRNSSRNKTYVDGESIDSIEIKSGMEARLTTAGPDLQFEIKQVIPDVTKISVLLDRIPDGDELALSRLWDECFPSVVRIARGFLHNSPLRVSDEEDIAASALSSLCSGLAEGRFPELNSRDSLWRLLMTITHRKYINRYKYESRQKRGSGKVRGDSAVDFGNSGKGGFDAMQGDDYAADVAIMLTEEADQMLHELNDPEIQKIALLKLEGFSNNEIADRMSISLRSVERRLAEIRERWKERMPQ